MDLKIGTAGWTIPQHSAARFPSGGTSLQRYSAVLPVVEINSSFHRTHRASTWERWRDSVPAGFRFSVKLPRVVTHQAKLVGCSDLLGDFLEQVGLLREKLAVLLVQLPPKLEFDAGAAQSFFEQLEARSQALVACEPRNVSWFSAQADALLDSHHVARVAADPAICDAAGLPGGWRGLRYWRLHGSPAVYRSSYSQRMSDYADRIRRFGERTETWCIFDNTASSAAMSDALLLADALA